MILSLTIGRASLGLADLVITNDPAAGAFWLPEDGLEEPDQTWRLNYAPDSADIHGRELLSASRDHSSIPATIYTDATSSAELAANKAALSAALGQFTYPVTLDLDGAPLTYDADPCGPRWGAVDSGMVRARIARCSVSIPIYPIPVSA